MNRIKEIEEYIKTEHINLRKSINNTKTLDLVSTKEIILNDLYKEYKELLKKIKQRLIEEKLWEAQFINYEVITTRYL